MFSSFLTDICSDNTKQIQSKEVVIHSIRASGNLRCMVVSAMLH